MYVKGFCPSCQKAVYVTEGADLNCPVCSLPLLEMVEGNPETAA